MVGKIEFGLCAGWRVPWVMSGFELYGATIPSVLGSQGAAGEASLIAPPMLTAAAAEADAAAAAAKMAAAVLAAVAEAAAGKAAVATAEDIAAANAEQMCWHRSEIGRMPRCASTKELEIASGWYTSVMDRDCVMHDAPAVGSLF